MFTRIDSLIKITTT